MKVQLLFLVFCLLFVQIHAADSQTDCNYRLTVVLEDKDFAIIQKAAEIYKKLPDEFKEKLKPFLEKTQSALLKAAEAGFFEKEQVDKVFALFTENSIPQQKEMERITVDLDDNDFAKIKLLADIYAKLPSELKEKLWPLAGFLQKIMHQAVEEGVLNEEDQKKIVEIFLDALSQDTEKALIGRMQISLSDKDFAVLEKAAAVYKLLPEEIQKEIKPYLAKAAEMLKKAAADGTLKKEDVERILKLFSLKAHSDLHPMAQWFVEIVKKAISLTSKQELAVSRGNYDQIDSLLSQSEQLRLEASTRIQVLLSEKDFEAIKKIAAVYTLLPAEIKEKIRPVMDEIKTALQNAAKAGVLKQEDVTKILTMFGI